MNKCQTKNGVQSKRTISLPLKIALAIAIVGVLGILIVDNGPWNKPRVQSPENVHYSTTDDAVRAVGATVTPTAPKLEPEPVPPGPKPVHPANATRP
jgi:hypothetical protein